MKTTYLVINRYTNNSTSHRTPAAALKACDSREGIGWQVIDSNGDQWDRNGPDIVNLGQA